MSVYLSRSPYLTQYGAGGARRTSRRRRTSSRRLWDNQNSFASTRRRSRGTSLSGIFSVFGKQTKQTAAKTGQAMKKSAQTFSEVAQAVKNVKGKKVKFEFGPNAVIGCLLVMVAFLSCAYLAHFNQVATKGYDLKRLEADRQQLLNQYEIKNMRLAEIQSMNTIINSEKADSMRRPSQVDYVHGASVIAAR